MQTTISMQDPKDGRVYLREAITVSFFFPIPIDEFVKEVRQAVELYLRTIPAGVLTWSSIGANSESWSPLSKTTVSRCLAQLDPARAKARTLTSFELTDGPLGAEAPGYGILVVGSRGKTADLPDEMNLIQMSFACEALAPDTVDAFVQFCQEVARLVPYVSGYAAPSLQWAMLHRSEAMSAARGLAMRHPGYDVAYNLTGRLRIDNRVRGARWLSFLGPKALAAVGGEAQLRESLSPAISVGPAGDGVMIRAGHMPELGDVNKGVGVPLLREVAAVLKPITAFRELVLLGNFAEHDETFFERWERRLL